jgi:hypothetical protein
MDDTPDCVSDGCSDAKLCESDATVDGEYEGWFDGIRCSVFLFDGLSVVWENTFFVVEGARDAGFAEGLSEGKPGCEVDGRSG